MTAIDQRIPDNIFERKNRNGAFEQGYGERRGNLYAQSFGEQIFIAIWLASISREKTLLARILQAPILGKQTSQEQRLIGSWGHDLSLQVDRWQDYLDELPEPPTAEEYKTQIGRIAEMLETIRLIYEALDEGGV